MAKSPLPKELAIKQKNRRVMRQLLDDWYGQGSAGKELAARDKKIVKLSDSLDEVSAQIFTADVEKFSRIQTVWKDVSGPVIGKLTTPLRMNDDVLYLGVRHSLLLQELPPALDLVKQNLAAKLGKDICRDIKLEVF